MEINNAITIIKDVQQAMTPAQALDLLKKGNSRFVNNSVLKRDDLQQVKDTSSGGQFPFAVVLGCIDSRVPAEVVFDQGIGDIFNTRIAGNFINTDILGSLEFSCKAAGSKIVVVLGHSACGAVKGACDDVKLGNLTEMLSKIKPAVDAIPNDGSERNSSNSDFVQKVVEKNVEMSVENVRKHSPVLKEMEDNGEIMIVGAVYDIKTGVVTFS